MSKAQKQVKPQLSPSSNKARRLAQHAKRQGLTLSDVEKLNAQAELGAQKLPHHFRKGHRYAQGPRFPLPMASLRELPDNTGKMGAPGFVIVAGVILEASPRIEAQHSAFSSSHTTPRGIFRRDPLNRLIPIETVTR